MTTRSRSTPWLKLQRMNYIWCCTTFRGSTSSPIAPEILLSLIQVHDPGIRFHILPIPPLCLPGIDAGGQDLHWTVQRQGKGWRRSSCTRRAGVSTRYVDLSFQIYGIPNEIGRFRSPSQVPFGAPEHNYEGGFTLGSGSKNFRVPNTPPRPPWTLPLDSRLDNDNSVGYNDIHGRNRFVQIASNRENKIKSWLH